MFNTAILRLTELTEAPDSGGGVDLNVNVSDSITITESSSILITEPDLGVIVTPGIQQIQGVRIV